MSSPLQVRFAGPADDAALCSLIQTITMPGDMVLSASYSPRFFEAIEVEGERPRVIVGEQDGRLAGCGLSAERTVYLNGKPVRLGYLSSLRLDPAIRSTTALARGYRFLRASEDGQGRVPFYLSTIMADNVRAVSALCSGRGDLPRYIECGRYVTHVITVNRRRAYRNRDGIRIRNGAELGPDILVKCLNEWGSKRQFYPVYTVADLAAPGGLLRGLRADDFLAACDEHGRPIGVLACWDQMPFRRYTVKRYQGSLRFLSPLLGAAGRLLGRALLPEAGTTVSCLHVACIAILNDDPRSFDCLFRHALAKAREQGRDYLLVGLSEGDPFAARAARLAHLRLHSGIYMVGWNLAQEATKQLDGRPLYLELGSL
jgi:hypothetical protein